MIATPHSFVRKFDPSPFTSTPRASRIRRTSTRFPSLAALCNGVSPIPSQLARVSALRCLEAFAATGSSSVLLQRLFSSACFSLRFSRGASRGRFCSAGGEKKEIDGVEPTTVEPRRASKRLRKSGIYRAEMHCERNRNAKAMRNPAHSMWPIPRSAARIQTGIACMHHKSASIHAGTLACPRRRSNTANRPPPPAHTKPRMKLL